MWGQADDINTGLTLREFHLFAAGYSQRNRDEWRRTAWSTAYLLNAWVSKGNFTAAKLLGEDVPQDDLETSFMTPAEKLAHARESVKNDKLNKQFEEQEKTLSDLEKGAGGDIFDGEDFAATVLESFDQ